MSFTFDQFSASLVNKGINYTILWVDVHYIYSCAWSHMHALVFCLTRRTSAHCWRWGHQEEEPAAEDTTARSPHWTRPYSLYPASSHSNPNRPSWASILLGTKMIWDERDGHRNQHLRAGLDFLLPGNNKNSWDSVYSQWGIIMWWTKQFLREERVLIRVAKAAP